MDFGPQYAVKNGVTGNRVLFANTLDIMEVVSKIISNETLLILLLYRIVCYARICRNFI